MKIDNPTTAEEQGNECKQRDESKRIDEPLNPFQNEIFKCPDLENCPAPEAPSGAKNKADTSNKQQPDMFEKLWSLPGIILAGLDKDAHEVYRDKYTRVNDEIDKAATERVIGSMSDVERTNFERDRKNWHNDQREYHQKFLRASRGTGMLGFPTEPFKPDSIRQFEYQVESMRAKILEEMRRK